MTEITQDQIDAMTKCVEFAKWARVEMEAGRMVHTPEGDDALTVAYMAGAHDAKADGWQPIETAPKSNSAPSILLWWPHWWHDPHVGGWRDYQWHSGRALAPCHQDDENGPTHWMPLPTPPEETT